jgi:hypothetical protein
VFNRTPYGGIPSKNGDLVEVGVAMSARETPITRWYWQQIGGLLIEEFPLVKAKPGVSPRFLDGLIVLGEENRVSSERDFSIAGKDVVAVQTKASRLGMYLMGQCLFSLELVKLLNPRTVTSVALCTADDELLRPMLEGYEGCRVVIFDGEMADLP